MTAQKREENLQRVPVAVTALTSRVLDERRITNVAGLASIVPNFQVVQQPSNAALPAYSLRGVLGGETSYQVDNGVSVYVDGVYLGRSSGTLFDVADIARIEVLRGPQGTLFGRNTTGGAVNIITRTPPGKFGIKQDLSYGRYHDFRSRTRIDLPAFGPIATSITYMHRQNDGYVKNLAAGVTRDYTDGTDGRIGKETAADTLGASNVNSVFAAARYDDNGPLTADMKFDYTKFRGSQLGLQLIGLRGANDIPGTNTLGGTYAFILSEQPALGGTDVISTKPLKSLYEPQRATDGLTSLGGSLTMTYKATDTVTIKNIAAVRKLVQDGKDPARITAMFRDFLQLYDGKPRTRHQMANLIIEADGADAARASCSVTVFQQTAELPLQPIITGDYEDRFERTTDGWRFVERRIANDLFGNLSAHGRYEYQPAN